MNVYIGQNTKNERLYRAKHNTMNVHIGQNAKNERLYRPKHKK